MLSFVLFTRTFPPSQHRPEADLLDSISISPGLLGTYRWHILKRTGI